MSPFCEGDDNSAYHIGLSRKQAEIVPEKRLRTRWRAVLQYSHEVGYHYSGQHRLRTGTLPLSQILYSAGSETQ